MGKISADKSTEVKQTVGQEGIDKQEKLGSKNIRRIDEVNEQDKKRLSKGAKLGIAAAVTALLAGSALLISTALRDMNGEFKTDDVDGTASKDNTEINVWTRMYEKWDLEYFNKKGNAYNDANRGVTIEHQIMPAEFWEEDLAKALASDTAPDVYSLNADQIKNLAESEKILALDELIKSEYLDDILVNVRESLSYGDKIWAYPQKQELSTFLVYRKDKFKEAGISEAPKSWEDFIEVAEKLKPLAEAEGASVRVLGLPAFKTDMAEASLSWQYSASGHFALNADSSAANIDTGFVDLASFWKDLYAKGLAKELIPDMPIPVYDDIAPFGSREIYMQFTNSTGLNKFLTNYKELYKNTGIAAAPTKDGSSDSVNAISNIWTYVINADSKQVKAAADFISWSLAENPAESAKYFDETAYSQAPVNKSVSEYLNENASDKELAQVVNDLATRSISAPEYSTAIKQNIADFFEDIVAKDISAEDAVKVHSDSIKELIENPKKAEAESSAE